MGLCELLAEGQYDNPRLMRPFRKATYYERIHCRRGPDEEDNDAGSSVGARSKGDGAPPPKHGKEDGGKMSSSTMETTQTFPGEIMMPGRRPIISGDSGNDGGHEESERRQPSSQDTESSSSSSTTYVMEESSSTSETAKTDTNDNPEQAGSSTTLETTPDASLAVVEEGMTTESAPGAAEDHQKRESERQQHPSEALDGSKSDGASEAAQRASAFEGNGEPKMGENVGRDGTTVADLPRPTGKNVVQLKFSEKISIFKFYIDVCLD
jgi:hypothetical protein